MSSEFGNSEFDNSDEQNDISESFKQTETVEFVDLLNHNDYEILTVYPFTIRKKSNHYEVKESDRGTGYIRVCLNGKVYMKHRLIAEQFIPNPDNLPQIDHKNRDRGDYHIENLRWVSKSKNEKNKSIYNGVQARYVDTIPDDAIVVDYYESRTTRFEFEGYYYHDGNFYYDNGMNYRKLNIMENKTKCRYVNMKDKNNKRVYLVIARFLEQHDLN